MSTSKDSGNSQAVEAATGLVTSGRDTLAQKGFINPPVVRGSTVLNPTAKDLHAHRGEFQYGRHGTPTTKALQEALMELEGPNCAGVGLAPSGVAAITTTLLGVLKSRGSTARHRQRVPPDTEFLRRLFETLWRGDGLFRSTDRRWDRVALQIEHASCRRRGPRLTILRDAGHSGHRRSRAP